MADQALAAIARTLRVEARATHQRRALVLSGPADWTLDAARAALAGDAPDAAPAVWLSDRVSHEPRLPVGAGERLLGREIDTLVYDAHSGLDLDALAAALGSLRGGGLFILLAPGLDAWPVCPPPLADSPPRPSRMIRHLANALADAPGVTLVQAGQPLSPSALGPYPSSQYPDGPSPPALDPAPWVTDRAGTGDAATPDQRTAIAAVLQTARGRARRPLVLTSDRGRGKSSALGLAAAELMAGSPCQIILTAPRHQAVAPVFAHAARRLPLAQAAPGSLRHGAATLQFVAPDHLTHAHPPADLLLVDEAAGIPGPLLEILLRRYPRVVFATTVHGYEGTGRGFEVRFRRTLDRLTPGWRARTLTAPIRWAEADPIEALLDRALLLDAAPAADAEVAGASPRTCSFVRLDRDALVADERRLRELFGLLVLAHYQTRPADLRHLLDGPDLRVYALHHRGHIAATALGAIEGALDQDLGAAVFAGLRRPRGNLLSQTLSAHAGIAEATSLKHLRLVRIAVHPAIQGRGLGRKLIAGVQADARGLGLDLLGASFGATADLLRFWRRCGLPAVHIGSSRNAASGAHAAVVLAGLSPAGEALAGEAQRRLSQRMAVLLAGVLRGLEPEIALELLYRTSRCDATPEIDPPAWRELAAFAYAARPFEAVAAPLSGLAAIALTRDLDHLTEAQAIALVGAALQHRPLAAVAALIGASGRAEVISGLRAASRALCQDLAPPSLAEFIRDLSKRTASARGTS